MIWLRTSLILPRKEERGPLLLSREKGKRQRRHGHVTRTSP